MRLALATALFLAFAVMVPAQDENAGKGATAPAVGLAVGQHAPEFAGADQFGHEVSNQTLRGTRGTIVLFFRSADW